MDSQYSSLTVNVFDGARKMMPPGNRAFLITVANGKGQVLIRDYFESGQNFALPFYDNLFDNYTVIAHADGYAQAGFVPVKCSPRSPQVLDIMLLGDDATFNFGMARWETLAANNSLLHDLFASGASDDVSARDRYSHLMETKAPALACLLNITTAMTAIRLPVGNPLQYFKELIWDESMAQDRFYGYADPALYDQVKLAESHGTFKRELGFALFHKGATDSYKQVQFGEANVQLTFHADDTKIIGGVRCIKMEPDIDYYRDLEAHALLEVTPNGISGCLTNPRDVYCLRWIAGRHADILDFDPPYVII